jgi:hypothetical protein
VAAGQPSDVVEASDTATPIDLSTPVSTAAMRGPLMRALSLAWVPLVASAISVVLSVASIYISTRQPEVLMLLPDVVRVAGGHASGSSYLYLQPSFVSTGTNERIEVIEDMTLTLQPVDGSAPPTTLDWKEQVALVDDGGTVSYRYQADAVPLLIGPRSAANPIALFEAPEGWFIEAGTYAATLTAERVVGSDPLVGRFPLTIPPGDLVVLDEVPERYMAYPVSVQD